MKTFDILDYGFESLPTENIDGKRYYVTPTGEKYPSVTSVTGLMNKESIKKWRKRVGEEKQIRYQQLQDMEHLHINFEDYIRNDNFESSSLQCHNTTGIYHSRKTSESDWNSPCTRSTTISHELQLAGE